MRLKGSVLPAQFTRETVQPLWDSRIKDLTALQQNYSESIIVALDTEMSSQTTKETPKPRQDVSEVGIAIMPLNGQITQPYEGIKQLHYEGGASAFTIQIRERTALPKEKLLGQVIRSEPKDVASVIESILAKYKGRRILVGFDLYNEFKWITDECPTIFSYFAAWLDVQEFAMQRCKEFAAESEPANLSPPGLSDVLKVMNIRDQRRHLKTHYAVNDALRSLIVLCGLASDPCLLSDMRSRPASRHSVQCYSQLKFTTGGAQHPFIARVSTAVNGGKLPPWSPHAVARHFAAHTDLKAVGLNWKKEKDKVEGVRFWQLSFRTVESLERFIVEMNGSTLDATKLLVSKFNFQESLRFSLWTIRDISGKV
jgi:hypothetical protein